MLANHTPGDKDFYKRWLKFGSVANTDPEADIVVIDHKVKVDRQFIRQFKNLKTIVTPNTAHTHIKTPLHDIALLSLKGDTHFLEEVRSVAEHTFYLMQRIYQRQPVRRTFKNKAITIVGYGRIGKHVAEIAEAYQMNVSVIDKDTERATWQWLFQSADIVSVHIEESHATRKIVDKELINSMTPDSIFINTARGSVIDEDALAGALIDNRIMGAAVDVVENIKVLNRQTPKLIVTPHIGGRTLEDRIATDEHMVAKLEAHLRIAADNHVSH